MAKDNNRNFKGNISTRTSANKEYLNFLRKMHEIVTSAAVASLQE